MSASYRRFAAVAALGAAASGLLYAVSFIVIARSAPATGATLAGLFLLTGALLSIAVFVALFFGLRDVDPSFAILALLFGVAGAVGSALHGGYDLANGINPPAGLNPNLPSAVDPRGLMTFGLVGIAILVFALLMRRSPGFPSGLAYLGILLGALVEVLYLGRLVILDTTNPGIVVVALLSGFIANPAWYAWIGVHLLRADGQSAT